MRKLFTAVAAGVFFLAIAAAQTKNAQCNRQCLEGFVNQYLSALAANDASKAPLAKNVKYTENAKVLPLVKPTEGLWAALTSLGDYKFYIADPKAGQVAFGGLVKESGKIALLSMRLKKIGDRRLFPQFLGGKLGKESPVTDLTGVPSGPMAILKAG